MRKDGKESQDDLHKFLILNFHCRIIKKLLRYAKVVNGPIGLLQTHMKEFI